MTIPRYRLSAIGMPGTSTPSRFTWTLTNLTSTPLRGFSLAVTSLVRIRLGAKLTGGTIVEQLANYHVIAPPDGFVLAPGGQWQVSGEELSHILRHYTDGPKNAAVYHADGTIEEIDVTPMTWQGQPGGPNLTPRPAAPFPADETPLSIIPWPAEVAIERGGSAPTSLTRAEGPPAFAAAFATISALATRLFPADSLFAPNGMPVHGETDADLQDEAYRLTFTTNRVTVAAGSEPGFRNGLVTLGQIVRGARAEPSTFRFPQSGTIFDAPRFGWRGAHLDVARQVYGLDELLAFVDAMAWNKLNRFHFHLNDDEAWRINVPEYPELAPRAGFRGPDHDVPPLFGSPFATYGIVYSDADIATLVDHASALGIVTIPEVDMPGHCLCVLRALPGLADPDEPAASYRAVQYYPNNALNPAREEVYAFVQAALNTIARLFPSPWIHIGGDEVSDKAWLQSPQALALMAANGWRDTFELQSHFLRRVQAMVRALGRKTGAWDEAAHGGGIDSANTYVVAWQKSEIGLDLASKGYQVVLAPAEFCYFDMAQSEDWWEPGATWAGHVSVETCYGFDPAEDWPEDLRSQCLGIQSCLWSENLAHKPLFDHMMFPRLSALAETAWTPRARKNFARFSALHPLMPVTGMR